jgi:hypothetical protein
MDICAVRSLDRDLEHSVIEHTDMCPLARPVRQRGRSKLLLGVRALHARGPRDRSPAVLDAQSGAHEVPDRGPRIEDRAQSKGSKFDELVDPVGVNSVELDATTRRSDHLQRSVARRAPQGGEIVAGATAAARGVVSFGPRPASLTVGPYARGS